MGKVIWSDIFWVGFWLGVGGVEGGRGVNAFFVLPLLFLLQEEGGTPLQMGPNEKCLICFHYGLSLFQIVSFNVIVNL